MERNNKKRHPTVYPSASLVYPIRYPRPPVRYFCRADSFAIHGLSRVVLQPPARASSSRRPTAEHRRRRTSSAERLLAAIQRARRALRWLAAARSLFPHLSVFRQPLQLAEIRELHSTSVQFLPSRAAPLAPRPISRPGGTFPPPERQCCAAPLSPLPPMRSFTVSHHL